MTPIRSFFCPLVILAFLVLSFQPGPSISASLPPTPSAPASVLSSQLTPPATIRVVHDARNTLWPDWPVGEVRVFDFEEYVRHVVPYEVPCSWPAEAVKAQAVAARTYGWYRILTRVGQPWDVTDYANTQMMGPATNPQCDAAAEATRGQHLLYQGQIILAQYSADNGDPTLDADGIPYLRGVEDPVSFGKQRNGHGHGLSQWGAQRWASRYAWDYQKILMHYYTGVSVELPLGASPDTIAPIGSIVLPWSRWYATGSRILVAANASDAYSGVSRADFMARFTSGMTATLGSDASSVGGWTAMWDVSAVPDQPITAPVVLSMTVQDMAGNATTAAAPAYIGLDRTPPTVTASLDAPYSGGPTVTLRLSGGDTGSGLAGVAFSNNWLWEGENLPSWTGMAVSDTTALNGLAWRARAGLDPAGNVFGPFTTGLSVGQYRAYFRLKTTGTLTTAVIARLDVITSTTGTSITGIIGLHEVRGGDFRAANEYQEMAVEFDHTTAGEQLEFRTHFLGVSDLYLDRVLVVSYPVTFTPITTWTISNGSLPATVQIKALDAAGNVSADAIVVVGGATPTPTQTPTATPTGPTATPSHTGTVTPSSTTTPTGQMKTPTQTVTLTPTATRTPTRPPATTTKTGTPTTTATPQTATFRAWLPIILAAYLPPPTATSTPGPTPICTLGVVGTFSVGREPHGIAVAPGRLYVANFTGLGRPGTVSVLDSTTGAPIAPPIPVGLAPNGAAYNPFNGMIYVANRDSNSVSVINTATNQVIATVGVGSMPNGVAVVPGTNRIYVANWGSNDISVIDGASNTVIGGRIGVGNEPAMVAANQETNLVYVANHGSNSVTVIRSMDNAVVQTIGLPGLSAPYGIAVDPTSNRVYVAGIVGGRIAIIDGAGGYLVSTSAPGGGFHPWQVAANPRTGRVFVTSSVGDTRGGYIYDGRRGTWLPESLPLGLQPEQGIAADPDSGRIYIANGGSDNVTVVQDCGSQ